MASTNERLQQAIAAARAGDTDQARELVDDLVAENPNNPHALFLRGMLAGSEEEQLEYLNRVLEIDPDHKAANRRLEQIAPAPKEDATILAVEATEMVEDEELVEEEEQVAEPATADSFGATETVIGLGALFADEDDLDEQAPEGEGSGEDDLNEQAQVGEGSGEDDSSDEQGEWGVPETVVTAAAVGAGIEILDDDATMIGSGFNIETDSVEDLGEEDTHDDSLDEAIMTAAFAAGSAASIEEDEDIPEWLMAETRSEEELTAVSSEDIWSETPAESEDDLPAWLTEETGDSWAQSGTEEVTESAASTTGDDDFDDSWATEYDDQNTQVDQTAPAEDEDLAVVEATEDEETSATVPEKPKKKSSDRGLEIALVILIAIALMIVIAVLYVLINPPF